MKEMPLLSLPVSTTVAALRQYWRCLMPVPTSPLAYTDAVSYTHLTLPTSDLV